MREDKTTEGICTARALAPVLPPEYFPGFDLCIAMLKGHDCCISSSLQYSRQTLQNRSRLRTPTGTQWITVPLKGGQFGRSISETMIDNRVDWPSKHRKALRFNYASAPYYSHYIDDILEIIQCPHRFLGELTMEATVWTHSVLGCKGQLLRKPLEPADEPTSLASDFPVSSPAEGCGVGYTVLPYRQNFKGFKTGLSILDLLLNHGPLSRQILESFSPGKTKI